MRTRARSICFCSFSLPPYVLDTTESSRARKNDCFLRVSSSKRDHAMTFGSILHLYLLAKFMHAQYSCRRRPPSLAADATCRRAGHADNAVDRAGISPACMIFGTSNSMISSSGTPADSASSVFTLKSAGSHDVLRGTFYTSIHERRRIEIAPLRMR